MIFANTFGRRQAMLMSLPILGVCNALMALSMFLNYGLGLAECNNLTVLIDIV